MRSCRALMGIPCQRPSAHTPCLPRSLPQVLAIKTLQEVEPLIAAAHGPGEEGKAAAVKAHLHEGAYSNAEVGGAAGAG